MIEFETKVKVSLTQEEIDDIMSTAFDGGITYWCARAETVGDRAPGVIRTSEEISRGGSIELFVPDLADEPSHGLYILDLQKLVNGMKMYADTYGGWPEDIDADIADRSVQFAVFGEVVFA